MVNYKKQNKAILFIYYVPKQCNMGRDWERFMQSKKYERYPRLKWSVYAV